jgi:hypothetical protein
MDHTRATALRKMGARNRADALLKNGLVGVLIGERAICAIDVFLGAQALACLS